MVIGFAQAQANVYAALDQLVGSWSDSPRATTMHIVTARLPKAGNADGDPRPGAVTDDCFWRID